MARNIVHEGSPADIMPYTNTTGGVIASGAVVKMANTLGVALVTIAVGGVGSVAVGGVVRGLPKVTGNAWLQGEKLLWDVSAGKFDNSGAAPASGDVTGGAIAWLSALAGDAVGVVKLTPGNTVIA